MIFQVMKLSISETQLLGMNKCWLRGVARAGDRLFLQRVSAQRCAGGHGHATKFDPGKDPGEKEESLMSWFGWFHKLSIHPLVNFTLRWKKKVSHADVSSFLARNSLTISSQLYLLVIYNGDGKSSVAVRKKFAHGEWCWAKTVSTLDTLGYPSNICKQTCWI